MKKVFKVLIGLMVISAGWAQVPSEEEIQEISSLQRGEFAIVRGAILRFRDRDELRIQDETGRLDIDLGDGVSNPRILRVGDLITVIGWVDDALLRNPLELYADELILSDGTRITINRRSWE